MTPTSNPIVARAAACTLLGCCLALSGCPRDAASLGGETADSDGNPIDRAGSGASARAGASGTPSGSAGSRAGSGAPSTDPMRPMATDAGAPTTDPMRPTLDAGTPTDPMRPPATDAGSPTGAACGSRGLRPCADGQYCHYPPSAQCGDADAPGVCEVIPGPACTREFVPVCGCDGVTYSNRCVAASNGVSLRSAGECGGGGTGSGDVCGGIAGFTCPTGEYCNFPRDAQCGAADQTGVCETMPQACTLEYNPVCGCDDQTYGNACGAAAAGVSVASAGECPP